jgi:PhnB protein
MRFAILRKADPDTERGALPSEELIQAMARYNERLAQAGVLLGGDGLKPSREGVRVQFAAGRPTVVDGPFAETRELLAGYTLIDVRSREEAIEWAKRWPVEDGGGNVWLEVRPLYELSDFGAGEGLDHHARIREGLAGR